MTPLPGSQPVRLRAPYLLRRRIVLMDLMRMLPSDSDNFQLLSRQLKSLDDSLEEAQIHDRQVLEQAKPSLDRET